MQKNMIDSRWTALLLFLLLMALAAACDNQVVGVPDGDDEHDSPQQCAGDDDCPDGQQCRDGFCVTFADGDEADGEDFADLEATPKPRLSCPAEVDFGTVILGSSRSRDLTLVNLGDAPLTITSLVLDRATSGEFAIATGIAANTVLAPGHQATATFRYTPADPGEDTGLAVLYSDDPDHPVWDIALITGYKGDPDLVVTPTEHDFGLTYLGTSTEPFCFTLENRIAEGGNRVIEVQRLGLASQTTIAFELLDAPIGGLVVAPGDPREVCVRFHPPSVGVFEDSLTIDCADDQHDKTLPLAGLGGAGQIKALPTGLDFGPVGVGSLKDMVLILQNRGAFDLTITAMALEDGGVFSIQTTDIPPDNEGAWVLSPEQQLTLTMRFAPVQAGDVSDQLSVSSDDPVNGVLAVGISGRGQAPGLVIDPPQAVFPGALVGQESRMSLAISKYVSYPGSVTLTGVSFDQVTVEGLPYTGDALFGLEGGDLLPVVLSGSEPATLSFFFAARVEGGAEAVATVHTEPAIEPPVTVTFSGLAVTPRLVSVHPWTSPWTSARCAWATPWTGTWC